LSATTGPRYAGSLVGRRTTKIAKCALLTLLPTYLITTHRANGLRVDRALIPVGQHRLILMQVWSGTGSTLGDVRLTEFWDRMNAQFGDVYAQSVAKDFVFDKLGGRTVERALADGVDAKTVWRAVCDTFKVPENMR
jgi:hypothetical protein